MAWRPVGCARRCRRLRPRFRLEPRRGATLVDRPVRHLARQLQQAERLGQDVACARMPVLADFVLHDTGRHHHDGCRMTARDGLLFEANEPNGLAPGDLGQMRVHENQVELLVYREADSLRSGRRQLNGTAQELKRLGCVLDVVGRSLCEQHTRLAMRRNGAQQFATFKRPGRRLCAHWAPYLQVGSFQSAGRSTPARRLLPTGTNQTSCTSP